MADLKMLGKLENIRLAQAEVKEDHFDTAGADPAYTQAFQEYGIPVEQLGAQEAGAWIRQRAIGLYLAAALDNWANARKAREKKGGGTSWKQLLEVAREADPDLWRCALRKAQATERKEDLERVLTSAPSRDLPRLAIDDVLDHRRERQDKPVAQPRIATLFVFAPQLE